MDIGRKLIKNHMNMDWHYSTEKNIQIVISLLKANNIKRVIASPGTINLSLIASMMQDDWFIITSCVDERSAAYMACGMAAETQEPVVISCTGATASRNYVPGLTEAYYRKLPVIAITATTSITRIGHLHQQMMDRTKQFNDLVNLSVQVPVVNDAHTEWYCNMQVNKALSECRRNGGGPVHINLETRDLRDFESGNLISTPVIRRIGYNDVFPDMPLGRVVVYIGSHVAFSEEETELIDKFCGEKDSLVICEHGSGYKGAYETSFSLVGSQEFYQSELRNVKLIIHIGEVAGDCDYASSIVADQVWRVSEDGEMRDPFRKLRYVFDMDIKTFFRHYAGDGNENKRDLYEAFQTERNSFLAKLNDIELPFSNIWLASKTSLKLPEGSVLHLGILNSFRSWNFFSIPKSVHAYCNSGGYGIDGGPSTLIGASLCNPEKLYFGVFGDLAFFYDLNSLGNHNVGKNLRVLLVNNGKGTEFRNYYHPWARFGEEADKFGSAAGHFGNKNPNLVRHYAEDLGFEYMSASSKEEYIEKVEYWLDPAFRDKSIVFEVFTNSEDESNALMLTRRLEINQSLKLKQNVVNGIRSLIGGEKARAIKTILKI